MLRFLLLPFTIIWRLITEARNMLYDKGALKSTSFERPVTVGIGNLSLGGSGKSPLAIFLANALRENHKIALLSRGYGRKTKGFVLSKPSDTFLDLGDEPAMYKRKFPDQHVAVCEDRVQGINMLIDADPGIEVVILDDVYQHRALKPAINILVTDYANPFFSDSLIPAGRLRESKAGKKRADVIIISKTPGSVSEAEKKEIAMKVAPSKDQLLIFSGLQYGKLSPAWKALNSPQSGKVVLLTGIVNGKALRTQLEKSFTILQHFEYKDHHTFTPTEIKVVRDYFNNIAGEEKFIVTTEKDLSRLDVKGLKDQLLDLPVYVLPVEVTMEQKDKEQLIKKIENKIHG